METNTNINRALRRWKRTDYGEAVAGLDFNFWIKHLFLPESFSIRNNVFAFAGLFIGALCGLILACVVWALVDHEAASAVRFLFSNIWVWLFAGVSALVCTGALGTVALFWVSEFQRIDSELNLYRENSEIDLLSGLRNRRGFMERLDALLHGFRRGVVSEVALLFFDIDHFKRFNDQHGHAFGDKVVQIVAQFLERAHRSYDVAGRWGGEEFVMVCPGSNMEQAVRLAQRIREGLEKMPLSNGGEKVFVTISVGVTVMRPEDDRESLIERADQLLYEAKEAGRNRVKWGA